jgi:hypothetical protein
VEVRSGELPLFDIDEPKKDWAKHVQQNSHPVQTPGLAQISPGMWGWREKTGLNNSLTGYAGVELGQG